MSINLNALFNRRSPTAVDAPPTGGGAAVKRDFKSLMLASRFEAAVARPAQGKVASKPAGPGAVSGASILEQASLARAQAGGERPSAKEGLDYGRFASMTPYQVYMANPNGLPKGWDWGQWALAAGKPNPGEVDASGAPLSTSVAAENMVPFDRGRADFDWGKTGAYLAREGGDGSRHTMTITPPAGWTGTLEIAGSQAASSLGGLAGLRYVVTDSSGTVVASQDANAAGSHLRFPANAAGGPYTVTVTFEGSGKHNFNCLHQP